MVTHAGADSDMPIVYFSLKINDKQKIIKAEKSKTIGEIAKSQLMEGYMLYKTLLCFFLTNPMFSVILFIFPIGSNFREANFCKTSIQKTMALYTHTAFYQLGSPI